jgi:hypothetical protein
MSRFFAWILSIAMLGLAGSSAVGSPRVVQPEELDSAALWHVGWREAAKQELVCGGLSRSTAEHYLTRRFAKREAAIERMLGQKSSPEIVLTLPPCDHFKGALDKYRSTLRILERRLIDESSAQASSS